MLKGEKCIIDDEDSEWDKYFDTDDLVDDIDNLDTVDDDTNKKELCHHQSFNRYWKNKRTSFSSVGIKIK